MTDINLLPEYSLNNKARTHIKMSLRALLFLK